MSRRVLWVMMLVVAGCGSRSSPTTSQRAAVAPVTQVANEASTYLRDARAAFTTARAQAPSEARATLIALRQRAIPNSVASADSAFIGLEIDRELALRALDAGDVAAAVADIEHALERAEQSGGARDASTVGLMLVAEEIYLRAGRADSARWAHTEAQAMLGRATTP